jgi:hypothetical protein
MLKNREDLDRIRIQNNPPYLEIRIWKKKYFGSGTLS